MTKTVTEQVAQEKKRLLLKAGRSEEQAERAAQGVRDYAAKRAAELAAQKKAKS